MLGAIKRTACLVVLFTITTAQKPASRMETLDAIAESYVRLSLEIGLYDADFIDAYYGPAEWKPSPLNDAQRRAHSYIRLKRKAEELLDRIDAIPAPALSANAKQRLVFLKAQLTSAKGRVDLLSGTTLSFDEESKALYGAVVPRRDLAELEAAFKRLDQFLPGTGAVSERFRAYREGFRVPSERIDAVFRIAMAEARKRTLRHIELPDNEEVAIELVTGQPWYAYNWYEGNNHSLIQVNTDLPFYIDSAIDLACHEGYPGHHVQSVLRDARLYAGRRWVEFSVQPLFSPMGLIAEGAANFAIELTFPFGERVKLERDVLFPLAGIDPTGVEEYQRVCGQVRRLRRRAMTEAARRYLDGQMSKKETTSWLRRYALKTDKEAELGVQFIERYRSYVINYDHGEGMVRAFITSGNGENPIPDRHWERLHDLLAAPYTPADLSRVRAPDDGGR